MRESHKHGFLIAVLKGLINLFENQGNKNKMHIALVQISFNSYVTWKLNDMLLVSDS